jgi:hypothetical protein
MNGPEHYREAERLGRMAKGLNDQDAALVAAQLATMHATLANTAAIATHTHVVAFHHDINDVDVDAWNRVTGVPLPTCSQCEATVEPGKAYCSQTCRNADDRHDTGEVSA